MKRLPKSRTADIVVQTLGKEILIYDLNTHKAYNLNETCAIIYQNCDGMTSFDELKNKNKFTDDLIFLALEQLKEDNLIEIDDSFLSPFAGISRREAVRKVGLATLIALPVITSLIAPTSTMAQSASGGVGQSCTTSADCAAGNVCATSGTAANQCCTGTNTDRDTSGDLRTVGAVGGFTCETFTCDAYGGKCCSGTASVTSCAENPFGGVIFECTCD